MAKRQSTRKHCRGTCNEAYGHQMRMLATGRRFAKYLPGYRLMAVDPGYLFVTAQPDNRASLDLPEDVVNGLLACLDDREQLSRLLTRYTSKLLESKA